MKAYIVTLNARGHSIRPAFGPFLWSARHGRYIWRGELATDMGQLAELFTQAAEFLRKQRNFYLELSAAQIETDTPAPQETKQANPVQPASAGEPAGWASEKAVLLEANAELLAALNNKAGKTKKKLADLART